MVTTETLKQSMKNLRNMLLVVVYTYGSEQEVPPFERLPRGAQLDTSCFNIKQVWSGEGLEANDEYFKVFAPGSSNGYEGQYESFDDLESCLVEVETSDNPQSHAVQVRAVRSGDGVVIQLVVLVYMK